MRWALVKVCLAVTAMVVIAFAVPLGLVIKEMARDRAFSDAERQAATIGPTLSITTDRAELETAVLTTEPGGEGRMAVHVPASEESDSRPVEIGTRRATRKDVETVRTSGRASISEVTGGSALLQPTALGSGGIAVVEVFVPEGEESNGVATAWLMLAGVGIALIVGSVAVADRLGVRMVKPAQRLAGAAHDLGRAGRGPGSARRGRRNCGPPPSRSTPWPTRSSSSSPTNGNWPPTSRTGCAPRSPSCASTPLRSARARPPSRPGPPSSSWSTRSTRSSAPPANSARRPRD